MKNLMKLQVLVLMVMGANVATAGLVSHWSFDGNLQDSVGGHHGTSANDPVYTTGVLNDAKTFGGIDGDHVIIANDSAFQSSSFKVDMQVYLDQGASTAVRCAISNRHEGPVATRSQNGLMMYVIGGKWEFWIGNGASSGWERLQSGVDAVDYEGQWTHLVFGYDAAAKEMFLHINDLKFTKTITDDYIPSSQDLFIGANQHSVTPTDQGYHPWKGAIDEVYFYNVPEPATVSILALGSLLAFKRRK